MEANWLFPLVGLLLFLFGWLYDAFVNYLHRTGREKGATAWLVVAGVAVTVGMGGVVIGFETVWKLTVLFAASGLPMIIGAWKRYTDERAAQEAQREADARRVEELAREMLDHE